jgi:GT2 family glycosyltransferase
VTTRVQRGVATVPDLPPEQRIVVANVNPGHVSDLFAASVADLRAYDASRGHLWQWITHHSGAQISAPRNHLVSTYLRDHAEDAHWLLMLDSDSVIPPYLLGRMLDAAASADAHLLGGLVAADMGPEIGYAPNLFQLLPDGSGTWLLLDYEDDALVQVAATGAACLLVHRDVLRAIRDDHAHEGIQCPGCDLGWFGEAVDNPGPSAKWRGEDVHFCRQAVALGFRAFVDTTLRIGHQRGSNVIWPEDTRKLDPNAPTAVVIPMRDRADLTGPLVDELLRQGNATRIYVMDNGSTEPESDALFERLATHGSVSVVHCGPDVGIHRMWNAGITLALAQLGMRSRVAFLNNDITIGAGFVRLLSRALADHPEYVAVCGNHDGRRSRDEVVPVEGIGAHGGFAGWAFMVRGEWLQGGYRFPEACRWWFGDNDLLQSIALSDRRAVRTGSSRRRLAGLAVHAHVRHVGGGTGGAHDGDIGWNRPEWDQMKRDDQAAFEAKWRPVLEQEAARA